MATDDRDILRIIAKHVNWHGEEGDRITVAEYFGREADDPDAFRPFDREDDDKAEAGERDNRTESDDLSDKGMDGNRAKTTPATVVKPVNRR